MKRIYIQPQSTVLMTHLQQAMCASGGVQSTSVSNVAENSIWGNSPIRRPIAH